MRQVARQRRAEQACVWQDGGAQGRHRQCRRCAKVTGFAIGMKGARHVGVINRSRGTAVAGLVRMLVMPDMLRASDRGLVPAVHRSPSPCELQRYHDEQENDQPVTHRANSTQAPQSAWTAGGRYAALLAAKPAQPIETKTNHASAADLELRVARDRSRA